LKKYRQKCPPCHPNPLSEIRGVKLKKNLNGTIIAKNHERDDLENKLDQLLGNIWGDKMTF
jgi:hypothetical protein